MRATKTTTAPPLLVRALHIEARLLPLLSELVREGVGAKAVAAELGLAHASLLRKLNPLYADHRLTLGQLVGCLLALGAQAPPVLAFLETLLAPVPQPKGTEHENMSRVTAEVGDVARAMVEITATRSPGGHTITLLERQHLDRQQSEAIAALRAVQ